MTQPSEVKSLQIAQAFVPKAVKLLSATVDLYDRKSRGGEIKSDDVLAILGTVKDEFTREEVDWALNLMKTIRSHDFMGGKEKLRLQTEQNSTDTALKVLSVVKTTMQQKEVPPADTVATQLAITNDAQRKKFISGYNDTLEHVKHHRPEDRRFYIWYYIGHASVGLFGAFIILLIARKIYEFIQHIQLSLSKFLNPGEIWTFQPFAFLKSKDSRKKPKGVKIHVEPDEDL